MMVEKQKEVVSVRLDASLIVRLERLAEQTGTDVSDVVRYVLWQKFGQQEDG